jgi:crotonobetainyl-CoA:carnitine CoA-transferase CaiB-like acyl-CoA transferase
VGTLDADHLLVDPRFESVQTRTANQIALESALNAELSQQSVDFWITHLTAAGIPAAKVAGLEQAVDSPIADERGTFQELGSVPLVRLPWIVDGKPVPWTRPAPDIGEHTRDILREIGYAEEEVDILIAPGGAAVAAP